MRRQPGCASDVARLHGALSFRPRAASPNEILVTDHPGASRRKALGSAAGFRHKTGWFARAATAARTMRGLVFVQRLRRVGAALIDRMRLPLLRWHAREARRGEDDPRRLHRAMRTILRRFELGHRPHIGKWSTIVAKIFVNRHSPSPSVCPVVLNPAHVEAARYTASTSQGAICLVTAACRCRP